MIGQHVFAVVEETVETARLQARSNSWVSAVPSPPTQYAGCASPRKRASSCAQRTTRARERSGGSGSRAPAPRSRRPRVVERPSSLGQRHLKANRNAVRMTRAGCHPAAGTRFHGPPGSSITFARARAPLVPNTGNPQEGGVTRLLMLHVDVADVRATVDRSIDTRR